MEDKELLKVQQLRPPRMKDKPNRSRLVLHLKEVFGFIPETIIIDKVPNVSNQIVISAVVPETLAEREKDGSNKDGKNS